MASPFDALFAAIARPALLAHLADAGVTYTDASTGEAVPVATAIVGAEVDEPLEPDGGGGRTRYRHRPVEVSTAEVPDPKRPDVFTVDGEAWSVHEVLGVQGGMARLRVVRAERRHR